METFETIALVREFIQKARSKQLTIGLVPTMGALHEGHLTLIRTAKKSSDLVVVSIFVNPTQFGPKDDFTAYPRTLEQDLLAAKTAGADAVFHPTPQEMYPSGFSTYVDLTNLTDKLCGQSRPGHFRGVATVVTKLFNILQPDKAFFGQKDAQHVLVIKSFAADLNIPVSIETVPIVREADGLALSSRNAYLTPAEHKAALILSHCLKLAERAVSSGERSCSKLRALVTTELAAQPLAKIDYVEIYSYPKLNSIETLDTPALLAMAVHIGKTRLLDNIILEV